MPARIGNVTRRPDCDNGNGETAMFPIGDDNSMRRSLPVVTYALIAINAAVFLLELSAGDALIEKWAFIPVRFNGAPAADAVTILTAMFMHGGWMHLFGNMLYLWIFGDNVEDRMGRGKFTIFYILCGLAATFAQFSVNPASSVPNVGASGAIAGVLGAYLLMFPKARVDVLFGRQVIAMPAFIVLGFWIVLQMVSGVGAIADTTQTADSGGIAYMAHVGGFVAGVALTLVMRSLAPPATGA
jgi:membrane associated rhomboid family serine protease